MLITPLNLHYGDDVSLLPLPCHQTKEIPMYAFRDIAFATYMQGHVEILHELSEKRHKTLDGLELSGCWTLGDTCWSP